VLVAVLVLDLLQAVSDEVSRLQHWKHVLVFCHTLEFPISGHE
jgi:hypothetical protein